MRLHWKLMITYAVVVLLVLLSANLYLSSALRGFVVGHLGDRLGRESRLAAEMWSGHETPAELDALADLIGQRLGLRATLIGGDGVVVGDSEVAYVDLNGLDNHGTRPEIVAARQGLVGRSERYSATLRQDMLYVARSIGTGRTVLRLAITLDEVRELQGHVSKAILLASALGLAVALVLAYGAARYESRSIADIIGTARDMAGGTFEGRVHIPDSAARELVELAHALQEMYGQLRDRVHEATTEEARLKAIIDSVSEGILVTDPDGRVLLANASLLRIFGAGSWHEGIAPVELVRSADVGDAIEQTLAGGADTHLEIRLPGPPERHLDVHVAPVTREGAPCGTVTVFYDITRLRRLETMRKDFVANVSHELRTPLTAIKGCAETLADGALDDRHAAERFVQVIGAHADRLANLLGDLLDLSRMESDQIKLNWDPFAVSRVASAAVESLGRAASDKEITTELSVDGDLSAFGDRELLEQALINLVDNAIKYTPDGGAVRVTARRLRRAEAVAALAEMRWSGGAVEGPEVEGEVILMEVHDTGIGIPSDEIGRVFERFYRVDKGRSRAMGGTGLGLSIVRHIVEAHGERVFINSELSKGSVFGFTLRAV